MSVNVGADTVAAIEGALSFLLLDGFLTVGLSVVLTLVVSVVFLIAAGDFEPAIAEGAAIDTSTTAPTTEAN
jgi:hypothetical protein